jgi:hypothetical protein
MSRRRVIALFGGILLVAAALAPSALAGKPTFERINVDATGADDFLSDACGVPVTTHALGHVTVRTFTDGGTGPAEIVTINIGLTATAGDNSYRFRDVGSDHAQVMPDGTVVLMVIGQLPFGFTGVLKLNPATGEVTLEPHHSLDSRVEQACAALTA